MTGVLEKYGMSRLNVTHVSQQFWCERQVEFSLEHPREETQEMAAGTHIHKELMLELVDEVPVTVHSVEDELYLMMSNIREGIRQILSEGSTRELYVFGLLDDIPVSGIIDELTVNDGCITILDHKTRSKPSLPPPPTFLTAEIQVMLYRMMLESLRLGQYRYEHFIRDRGLQTIGDITSEFREQLESQGLYEKLTPAELSAQTFDMFTRMPPLSDYMIVRYLYQATGEHIGDKVVLHDGDYVRKKLDYALQYWKGGRVATPVRSRERWKCNYCEYRGKYCDG